MSTVLVCLSYYIDYIFLMISQHDIIFFLIVLYPEQNSDFSGEGNVADFVYIR